MPFDTSASRAIDALRSNQSVHADSTGAIDEEPVDLVSQFHEKAKADEQSTKDSAHNMMSDYQKGAASEQQLNDSIQKHQNAQFRSQFMSDYMKSSAEEP
jgi:hypothetical protein